MDLGSSNGSSVTSLDLHLATGECMERPLSPVLSTSKINRRVLRSRKINRQSSKVKLSNKFNEDIYSNKTVQNEIRSQYKNTTISHMRAVNIYEEQRKRYYDILCDDSIENIYKPSHSVPIPIDHDQNNEYSTTESSAPTSHIIRNAMNDDGIETCVNYHYNQNSESINFYTASGKNIDLSDDSLQKSSAIFDDIINFEDSKVTDPSIGYNTIFKNPTNVKKKLSKIPVLNQGRNTYTKTKATRSTYDEIKINMSNMTLTQTHVDTMEECIDSNDTSNDYMVHEADSSATLHDNVYGDNMNKIFTNKKFVEFSSSSIENTTYSDTIVGTGDIFAKHTKSKFQENLDNIDTKSNTVSIGASDGDIINEDWTDTQHINKTSDIVLKNTQHSNKSSDNALKNLVVPSRHRQQGTSSDKQNTDSNISGSSYLNNISHAGSSNECKALHTQQMETIEEQPVKKNCGQKFNLTPSKNVVVVTLPPKVCDAVPSYRNVVELHRNTNFANSNDSVQHVDLIPEHDVEQKKKQVKKYMSEGFSGFTPDEQQQARKMFVKVYEAVERKEQALEASKIKKLEKKHLKEKKSKRMKHPDDKCSISTCKGEIEEYDSKVNKQDKPKHKKTKTKDNDSGKGSRYNNSRKSKSRNASISRNTSAEPASIIPDSVGYNIVNQDVTKVITYDQVSVIAQETCKKVNKKRKDTPDITDPCTDLIVSDNTKKTIEVSPNQKKFKIQIDCNSKFRINISCNSESEESKLESKAIECGTDNELQKKLINDVIPETQCETKEYPVDGNNHTDIVHGQKCIDYVDMNAQEPKGKKFMNKAHKLYRDAKKLSESSVVPENRDSFDEQQLMNKKINNNILFSEDKEQSKLIEKITRRSRRPSEGINTGSEPNYDDSQDMNIKADYADYCGLKVMQEDVGHLCNEGNKRLMDLNKEACEQKSMDMGSNQAPFSGCGFKTAGGKGLKISKKALDNAKKMYESTDLHNNIKGIEGTENVEHLPNRSRRDVEISLKSLSKAKKLFNNLAADESKYNETHPNYDHGHLSKDEKAERVLNKMRKLYENLNNEDSAEDLTDSIIEMENIHNLVSEANDGTEISVDARDIESDYSKKTSANVNTFPVTGFVSASGKEIKITDNAMVKAKEMYMKVSKEAEQEQFKEINYNSSSSGFRTASGKAFQISEEAMSKARKLYENTADERQELQSDKSSVSSGGFKRSLAKDFGIPENSETSKFHVNALEDSTDLIPNVNTNIGFMSASGKNVKISERSLKKARQMYESITQEPEEFKQDYKHDGMVRGSITRANNSKTNKVPVNSCATDNVLSASRGRFDVPSDAPQKAKSIFDDLSYQAGDYDNTYNKFEQKSDDVNYTGSAQELMCNNPNPSNFCMGDYVQSNDSLVQEKTSPPVNTKVSKKAFELLEDVVETVDHALQNIDERLKRPKLSISRRRLGVSRCKQINISNEKLERAKLLFKEDFNESIKTIKNIATPVKLTQPSYSSTPILNKMNSSFSNTCTVSPVQNRRSPPRRNNTKSALQSTIVLQEPTKGIIDDWSNSIDQEMALMELQIKVFEERKGYLVYQKEALKKNTNVNIRPQPGVLLRRKEHVKLHLNDLKTRSNPDGILDFILGITPQNADLVHFNYEKSINDLLYAYTSLDGALIVPNTRNLIGLTEVEVSFKIMPGVDLNLIPHGWIRHHYKLIVWKLASYERFLCIHLKGCLNIENVVQQLKYRYDREIDKAERPALRKILEKDDVPQKRMVLCVSDITETEAEKKILELCDGWYCIKTIIDDALTAQIIKGKIKIGTKLITSGAQLINCDGCHPLEVPDFVRLKISCNSTRRAPWFAKLGYQRQAGPLLVSLNSIKPDGGMIGCVKLYIARIYPLRFMEQIEDAKIWRNNKAEEKRAREFENDRLNKMEKVHYDVQKQYEKEKYQERKNKALDCAKLSGSLLNIHCPKTLLALLESSNDPDSIMEHMSPSQRANVLDYRQTVCMQRQLEITRKISEEMEKLKLAKRKVVSILKLLVVDASCESEKAYQFCVWNPSEDDLSLLREYNVYFVYNILPRFNGELFSTNKTFFRSDKKMSYNKFKRQIYPISMLLDRHYHPSFNEFDTVGIVVLVNITESEQSLWLADTIGNLLFIKVKDGPKFCRLLDDIAKGDVVSILNVIYCQPHADYGVAYANQFTIVTKSMQNYLRESIEMFKMQLPKDLSKFLSNCLVKVEKSPRLMEAKTEKCDAAYLQCGLSLTPSLKAVIDDSSEEGSVIPQNLTATDIAMSLIDTDKLM